MNQSLKEKKYTIYMHKNKINGKVYIGQTCLKPEDRWQKGYGYRFQPFWKEILNIGWDNFSHIILETNLDEKEVNEREQYWIKYYKSDDPEYGYNRTSGGSTHSIQLPEVNERRRNSVNKYWQSEEGIQQAKKHSLEITGEKNPMYGKKHTDEAKEKIRQAKINNNPIKGRKGIKNHLSKSVYCFELNTIFQSIARASEVTGADCSSISRCCKNKQNKAGNLHWRYTTLEEQEKMKKGELLYE